MRNQNGVSRSIVLENEIIISLFYNRIYYYNTDNIAFYLCLKYLTVIILI